MSNYLTGAQRNLLAPVSGGSTRNGFPVPTSDQEPFAMAASWAWALNGEYVNANDPYSAPSVYDSDQGAFVFDADRTPTGLNASFFEVTDMMFPQTVPYHVLLANNIANALQGNEASQDACRIALMKMIAELNGLTVLPDNGSAVYTVVMKSDSWYRWDHWGIGVQSTCGSVTTYQQKVGGSAADANALHYNCGVMWDEDQVLTTTIRVDGLLSSHVSMLNQVV